MFPSQKTHITPPATEDPSVQEAIPPKDRAGERVAPAEHLFQKADSQETATECDIREFRFKSIQGATGSLLL